MAVATACSKEADTATAFAEAYAALVVRLGGGDPDLLILHYTADHDAAALCAATTALPARVQVHGATTCLGVMTETGVFRGGPVLGLLGLRRSGVVAGSALRPKGADPQAAASEALAAALAAAGRSGEVPDLVLLAATAGDEGAMLAGIAATVGRGVPVFGGTASGTSSGGDFDRRFGRVAVRGAEAGDALALTAVFAPMPISRAFHGGCVPTGYAGVVTGIDAARVVRSIDGAPAAAVYAAWIEAHSGMPVADTDLLPLGREVGRIGDYPLYALTHVTALRPDGGIGVMTDFAVGDEVQLMAGSAESVAGRPARAMEAAIDLQCAGACSVAGGLVALCAGLLPRVENDLEEIQAALRRAILGRPFLVAFTFGELGNLGETPVHGNLMISTLVFGG